jgi:GNAT superfamily N-acetyltransferase
MNIRYATPSDTTALRWMMAISNGYERPAARAMIERFAAGWSVPETGHEIWMLEEGGEAAGFYQLIPHSRDQELDLFFTADAFQGRGVGRRLFAHMVERAKALAAETVIIASNPEAADFYRRMGAVDIGIDPPGAEITWERPKLALPL